MSKEVTMEKIVALAKTEDLYILAPRFMEVLQIHGITVLWVWSSRTTSRKPGGKSLYRNPNTT